MRKYKIAICRFPGDGWECAGLTTWLMRTLIKMKREEADINGRIGGVADIVHADTPIPMQRNLAIKEAKQMGCDYALMLDSDNIPDYLVGADPTAKPFWETAWEFMMQRREAEWRSRVDMEGLAFTPDEIEDRLFDEFPPATIAAPYCGPPPVENCYVFAFKSMQSLAPDPSFKLEMIERDQAALRSGIEPVPALPTGLILYDLRVFGMLGCDPARQLGPPWYEYEYTDEYATHKSTTEDVYQTRNASLIGLPQYVAWDCWAAHLKDKFVGKPQPLTQDMIQDSLVEAAKSGRMRRQRLHFVTRPAPALRPKPTGISQPLNRQQALEEHAAKMALLNAQPLTRKLIENRYPGEFESSCTVEEAPLVQTCISCKLPVGNCKCEPEVF